MAREVIAGDGTLVYRTKLLRDERQALRFALCLSANSRFDGVEVVPSRQSKGEAWFVKFRPSDEKRQAEMRSNQSQARQERAQSEGLHYLFVRDDTQQFWWCWSVSGEVYEVSNGSCPSCSCPDFQFRCKNAGLECKHILALRLQHTVGMVR